MATQHQLRVKRHLFILSKNFWLSWRYIFTLTSDFKFDIYRGNVYCPMPFAIICKVLVKLFFITNNFYVIKVMCTALNFKAFSWTSLSSSARLKKQNGADESKFLNYHDRFLNLWLFSVRTLQIILPEDQSSAS